MLVTKEFNPLFWQQSRGLNNNNSETVSSNINLPYLCYSHKL